MWSNVMLIDIPDSIFSHMKYFILLIKMDFQIYTLMKNKEVHKSLLGQYPFKSSIMYNLGTNMYPHDTMHPFLTFDVIIITVYDM